MTTSAAKVFAIPDLVGEIYKHIRKAKNYALIQTFAKINRNCKNVAIDDSRQIYMLRCCYARKALKQYCRDYKEEWCEIYVCEHVMNYEFCNCNLTFYKRNIPYIDIWLEKEGRYNFLTR